MTVHDTHCHFLSTRFYEALGREKSGQSNGADAERVAADLGWEAPGSADALAERWVSELDRHHVSRAALIASVPGDETSVAAAVRRYPQRFVGFFALNATAPDAVDRATQGFGELGLEHVLAHGPRARLDHRPHPAPRIARSHGGEITLSESPIGGLRATVKVPV